MMFLGRSAIIVRNGPILRIGEQFRNRGTPVEVCIWNYGLLSSIGSPNCLFLQKVAQIFGVQTFAIIQRAVALLLWVEQVGICRAMIFASKLLRVWILVVRLIHRCRSLWLLRTHICRIAGTLSYDLFIEKKLLKNQQGSEETNKGKIAGKKILEITLLTVCFLAWCFWEFWLRFMYFCGSASLCAPIV